MEAAILGKLHLHGFFTTFTGLCIGRSGQEKNGAIPTLLVRHPIHLAPFIPASSLKGVVRYLLEKNYGPANEALFRIFGTSRGKTNGYICSPMTVFYDAPLVKKGADLPVTEVKIGTRADRITAQSSFYAYERISAGSCFSFELLYDVEKPEDLKDFALLLEGLRLLENFYIGGHGKRGQGQIKFGKWTQSNPDLHPELESGLGLTWRTLEYYQNGTAEKVLIPVEDKLDISSLIEKSPDATKNLI